jgi:DNA-binding MarR family transcriptional regulator/GNAT superfamily N-acetyltransferase
MAQTVTAAHIESVRRFGRFYTRQIGALREGYLESPFSLAESRVLFELAQRPDATASAIAGPLGLDPGYLSRILKRFERKGLIARRRAADDARRSHLTLTDAGRLAFTALDRSSAEEIRALLGRLPSTEQTRIVGAMRTIEQLVGSEPCRPPISLRRHRPGDLGWIVHRHGVLYAREYGFDERFEGLVAGIVAEFIANADPARERCWIAEADGGILGSVLLVRQSEEAAKLRLLYVEPEARGQGAGRRLVEACVAFAREVGYRRITLWTNSVLVAARQLYERAGFRLIRVEPHHSFGQDLVGETWELELDAQR